MFERRNNRTGASAAAWVLRLGLFAAAGASWASEEGVAYTVRFSGVPDDQTRAAMEQQSLTVALTGRPPATEAQLLRRAKGDVGHLEAVLQSRGFYDARVDASIDTKITPARVMFSAVLGRRYRIGRVNILYVDDGEQESPPPELRTRLKAGQPAVIQSILNEDARLVRALAGRGYPFARMHQRDVDLDRGASEVHIVFRLATGPAGNFGPVSIQGLDSVHEDFVRRRIPWREGARYNAQEVADLRKSLALSGLFAVVTVDPGTVLDEYGRLPVAVTLRERKHRTLRAGVSYGSDTRFGGRILWEHRNLFGRGERFELGSSASDIELAQTSHLEKPDFFTMRQSLLIDTRLAEDSSDAYTSRSVSGSAGLKRVVHSTNVTMQVSVAYKYSAVDETNDVERTGLISLPLRLEWRTRSDLLDPTRGRQLFAGLVPYRDTLGQNLKFLKSYADLRAYFPLARRARLVWAWRLVLGSIVGADRDEIPADERFYAGGGGSVRGYEYQSIGARQDDTPLGGTSLTEISSELRFRPSGPLGWAVFADGGSVSDDPFPASDQTMQWAAGLGLRYRTRIGPFRVDVAMPLNGRDDIDKEVQFYISLGQAF